MTTDFADRDWTLVVGGRGDAAYESMLKNRYADSRVRFLGFVNPTELLAQIDMLVVPSLLEEPLGRVLIEACAHGVPVIASRRGGIPEVVEEGRTGLLFEPGHSDGLRVTIQCLLDAPHQLDEMKPLAYGKWRREFTPQKIFQQYQEIYAMLSSRHHGSP